jgi:hypothetical protein
MYNKMKKLALILLAIGMIGASYSQMAIPGEVFASNPARFNGRKVAIKNIEIVKADAHGGPSIGGPAGSFQGAPGAVELQTLLQLTHVVLHVDSLKYLYFSKVHLSTKDVSLWQIT